jgi:hypothetical protein
MIKVGPAGVKSSWIAKICYDPDTRTAYMQTLSGCNYKVLDMPLYIFAQWHAAPSLGQFFNMVIHAQYSVLPILDYPKGSETPRQQPPGPTPGDPQPHPGGNLPADAPLR